MSTCGRITILARVIRELSWVGARLGGLFIWKRTRTGAGLLASMYGAHSSRFWSMVAQTYDRMPSNKRIIPSESTISGTTYRFTGEGMEMWLCGVEAVYGLRSLRGRFPFCSNTTLYDYIEKRHSMGKKFTSSTIANIK